MEVSGDAADLQQGYRKVEDASFSRIANPMKVVRVRGGSKRTSLRVSGSDPLARS